MLKGPKALYWLLGLMLLLLIVLTHTLLRDSYLQLQASKQLERVEVYQSALYATLSRHDYLPQVLSENDELFERLIKIQTKPARFLSLSVVIHRLTLYLF